MTLAYIEQVPHHLDGAVKEAALHIFRNSRSISGGLHPGNAMLKHCEEVAVRLVRTYVLMDNQGGREYALLYAKVADLFGALWYFSSGCQRRIEYRHLRADLFEKV